MPLDECHNDIRGEWTPRGSCVRRSRGRLGLSRNTVAKYADMADIARGAGAEVEAPRTSDPTTPHVMMRTRGRFGRTSQAAPYREAHL